MPSSVPSDTPLKVSIATLGCKLNQYESEAILTQFRAAGYEVTRDETQADICVVNTCAVTSAAESKARALLRSTRRRNPTARLLAVGCMSERTPAALTALGGVDAILGNSEKEHILDFLPQQRTADAAEVFLGETTAATEFGDGLKVEGLLGRTRSFLKVQDGCSQKCTYCIVPKLRGTGRSLPIAKAVEQATCLADLGFSEIVLTGVALGTYGFDLDLKDGLASLLAALEKIPGLKRLRLGSVEPWAVSDRFLKVIADSSVICPHLHIPLQSADDFVLHRMNRRYLVRDIQKIFDTAYSLRQDWGFGSDIILGFPGETQELYGNTKRFLANSPLSYLHIFPYSARPGTASTKLPDPIPDAEKKERVADLHELDSRLRLAFRKRNLNTRQSVLFENRFVGSLLAGHTANYLDVYVNASDALAGEIRDTIITRLHPNGVVGELAS